MQLSEKFRRGVVVPIDDAAAAAFADEDVPDNVQVRFVQLAGQAEFEEIWKTGFFTEVNAQTGCLIDDFEEEVVPPELVGIVGAIALEYARKGIGGVTGRRFFRDVAAVSEFAQHSGRPMYFVL